MKYWTHLSFPFATAPEQIVGPTFVDSAIQQGDTLLRTLIWVYGVVDYVGPDIGRPDPPGPMVWWFRSTNGDHDPAGPSPADSTHTDGYELLATGLVAFEYAGSMWVDAWTTDTTPKLPTGTGDHGTNVASIRKESWFLSGRSYVDSSAQRRFDLGRPEFEFGAGTNDSQSLGVWSNFDVRGYTYARQLWERR